MYHPQSDLDDEEYIELWNTGEVSVDLSGWSIKGISYVFPSGSKIEAGEYLVVAKNPDAYLSTYAGEAVGPYDGVMKDGGELLHLVDADENEIDRVEYSDRQPWPVAADGLGSALECINPSTDNSHPRDWRAGGSPGFLNEAYSDDIPPFITDVVQLPNQPTSSDPLLITARVEDLDGIVSVTLSYQVNDGAWQELPMPDDGNGVDAASGDGIYSAQIPAAPSQSLVRYKIMAVDTAMQETDAPMTGEPSSVLGAFVYDGELQSKIPVYWIFLNNGAYTQLQRNPSSNDFVRGTVAINGRLYDNVGIRFRGQWARSWPKKSWKLRFNKDNYMNGRRTVNLNSCFHDRAYIREYLCYRLYREAGCRACKAEMVQVYLNGEFYGVEVDVEQVNEQFLEENGLDSDGNLYKSKQGGDLRPLRRESNFHGPYEKKTNEYEDWSDLKEFADGLAETPSDEINAFLQQNVPVDEILRYWAATTILQNWDAIIKNHYLYHDTDDTGLWYMIPWDLDRTWGEYASWDLGAEINILAGMRRYPPGFGLPSDWWNRLIDTMLQQPDLLDRYYANIRLLLNVLFTEERINGWIDEQYELIQDLIPADQRKWGTHGDFEPFPQEIENCKIYVTERREFLYESLPAPVSEWAVY